MMSRRSSCLAFASLLLVALPTAADAAQLFNGPLSGAQEVPPNASTATGFGEIVLADDGNSISVMLSWSGLTAPASAGHIHCCSAPGANAGVAIGLAPANSTAGSLSGVFDLTSASTYSSGFLSANGGTAAGAQSAFLTGLTGNRAYFNLHNASFPGGEIRGQILAVPEPGSWAMLIIGFGAVGYSLRRRRGAGALQPTR